MNWRKSSYSKACGNCVETGQDGAVIAVRDTKDAGTVLGFSPAAWRVFTAQVRDDVPVRCL